MSILSMPDFKAVRPRNSSVCAKRTSGCVGDCKRWTKRCAARTRRSECGSLSLDRQQIAIAEASVAQHILAECVRHRTREVRPGENERMKLAVLAARID